ncbi:hypothetical protein HHL16_18125 [Pseudoflavitalea sp. G-6-1-2]|uniref:SRPBCC domain-containing protein n=1 Tax=Pseudoflavitalea sp. G-6-1-2 TaxID=2728841 RepID=UPI00146BDCAB|nr:SRPBCC domain-containing protein [Pseudoflavitalea sp. G-6-1-2]NML22808.1 hypothetical protein [Pseudoflavitalea sp. G-6-1-2]
MNQQAATAQLIRSIQIDADPQTIWKIVTDPNQYWGAAFGEGTRAESDWQEGARILWKDGNNNIGAYGKVEVNQPAQYLQLHYTDNPEAGPDAPLGGYFEKFRLSEKNNNSAMLTIEAGKIEEVHLPNHQEMWDRALEMIKKAAEA